MSILKQTLLKNVSEEEPMIPIPPYKLIVAIRESPALYDKSHAHYNNKKVKATLWNKIAEELFPKEWLNWSKTEKTTAVCYMQKRWNNLRTTFAREVKKTIKRKHEELHYDDSLVTWQYYHAMLFMKNFMNIQMDGTPVVFEKDALSESNNMQDQSVELPIKHEENEDFELLEVQYLEDNSNDSGDFSLQNVSAPEFIKINNEDELNDTDTDDEVKPIKKAKKVHEGSLKRKASSSNSNTELLKLLERNDNDQNDTDTEVEVTPKKKPNKVFRESIHRSPIKNSNLSFHKGDNSKKNKTPESIQSVLPVLSQDANKLDQDIYFAMSLVPLLKELSPSQKLQAQIDILTLFKKYKKDDN